MARRHHYPSGLMRLSRRRKGQAITAGAVFSPETRRGPEKDGGGADSAHTCKQCCSKGFCLLLDI